MKTLAALFSLVILVQAMAGQAKQKCITVGYALDDTCDAASLHDQLRDQIAATETFFAVHDRSVTILLVPVRLSPAPLAHGEMAVNDETMAWAGEQDAANPSVDYIVLGTERQIRFGRTAAGVKVNGIAAAYSLYGTKVCLMNVRTSPRNVFIHEFTHFLGYKGAAADTVHSTDERNLMSAQSLNQWGADDQLLALWDNFSTVIDRGIR